MTSIQRLIVFLLCAGVFICTAAAAPYSVSSGYDHPPAGATPATPTPITLLELPVWIILLQIAFIPLETFTALKSFAFLGYRQITRSNILQNSLRQEIFDRIQEEPGIHLHDLARKTDATLSTIRYHCAVLERLHTIKVVDEKGFRRFFQNGGRYSEEEQKIISCLRSETSSKILRIIMMQPGISRKGIADAIRMSGPSVTWHMQRLEETGIISVKREGRSVRYIVEKEVLGSLSGMMMPGEATNLST